MFKCWQLIYIFERKDLQKFTFLKEKIVKQNKSGSWLWPVGPLCHFWLQGHQSLAGPPSLVYFRGQSPETLSLGLSNQENANSFRKEGDSGGVGKRTQVPAPQARAPLSSVSAPGP